MYMKFDTVHRMYMTTTYVSTLVLFPYRFFLSLDVIINKKFM